MKRITLTLVAAIPVAWIATAIGDNITIPGWLAFAVSPGTGVTYYVPCYQHSFLNCLGQDIFLALTVNICVYGALMYLLLTILRVERSFLDDETRRRAHNRSVRQILG